MFDFSARERRSEDRHLRRVTLSMVCAASQFLSLGASYITADPDFLFEENDSDPEISSGFCTAVEGEQKNLKSNITPPEISSLQ